MEHLQRKPVRSTLALAAAGVVAALAMANHQSIATIVWRCVVAFVAVWAYQRVLWAAWSAFPPEAPAEARRAPEQAEAAGRISLAQPNEDARVMLSGRGSR